MGPTWGPPRSCRPQMGPTLVPWTLLSGNICEKDDDRLQCYIYHVYQPAKPLQWRHDRRDSVSNHQPHKCLLNRLFRRRSKESIKAQHHWLCAGNSPVPGEFPAQMASNAENVSIWWRHHSIVQLGHHSVCRYPSTKRCSTYSRHNNDYSLDRSMLHLLSMLILTILLTRWRHSKWLARSGGTWSVKKFSRCTIPSISLKHNKCPLPLLWAHLYNQVYTYMYNHIYIHQLLLGPWPLSFKTHHACY